jgi:hypothetical protein
LNTSDLNIPLTFIVAEAIDVDVKAATAYGYSMETDTKTPIGDNSDTV